MPSKIRYIQKKDSSFDRFIEELVEQDGFGIERQYFGITTRERAEEVRLKMRSAGRHLGVSVKSFWTECKGCPEGGQDCRFHVKFSAYDPEVARAYMQRKSDLSRG